MNSFLVLPACEKGRGGGHLFRSIALTKALRAGGSEAWLFADNKHQSPDSTELWLDKETISQKKWTLIVLDRFRTGGDELKQWHNLAPVLGIDEGLSRNDCDFLIDLLPNLFSGETPNLCAPSLLPLPQKRRVSFKPKNGQTVPSKILVSFGAEDAEERTVETAAALHSILNGSTSITAVLGPLRKSNTEDKKILEQEGITVIEGNNADSVFSLQEILADYDLLITHFGITAFEALHARVPVLLINPGPYHEQLSRHAGFFSLISSHKGTKTQSFVRGTGKKDISRLYLFCIEKSEKAALRWGLETRKPETLAAMLLNAKPLVRRNCPLCGALPGKITGRFPDRTYRLCSCGTLLMDRFTPPPTEYNRDYFFSEYQKQYGKTYLEDFPKLQKDGERRLGTIIKIFNHRGHGEHKDESEFETYNCAPKLLDIGCAYGPFLAASQSQKFIVTGIDPSQDAVNYVRKILGLNAIQGTFPESLPELHETNNTGKDCHFYDVVTLWYVIEHFEDPGKALRAVNDLLKIGGILAFSTPSAAGISRRKSLHDFLEHSPADHWTIWDPRSTAAILSRYGFKVKKRIITGHHPERFPGLCAHFRIFWFYLLWSRIFGLGDTCEIYAVKVRNCDGGDNG